MTNKTFKFSTEFYCMLMKESSN